jgi:c-di-AMP phosphodiesterase-like protein
MIKESLKHSYYLNIIKRILKANFVGWVEEKDKKYLKVTIKNQKIPLIPFEGEIRHETYNQFIKDLLNNEK